MPNTPISPSSSYYYYYSSLMRLQPNQSTTYPKKLLNYLQNIHIQVCGYLKTSFCNMGTRYETKLGRYCSRSHKSVADAHPQNSFPGKDTRLKTTQAFFINACELYVTSWSLSEEVKFSLSENFLSFSSASPQMVAPAL